MRVIIATFVAVSILLLSVNAAQAAEKRASSNEPVNVTAYATLLHRINPQLPAWQSSELARHVLSNAAHWKIDPNLLVAIVTVESRWRTHAESRVGAIGLGQLMPETAHSLHVDPHDATQNLAGSARYLSGLLQRFRYHANRYQLACAAYNAGPHAVSEFGGIPPYAETEHYVVRVMDAWHSIAKSVHLVPAAPKSISQDVAFWSGG